jgi:hypothetical protein
MSERKVSFKAWRSGIPVGNKQSPLIGECGRGDFPSATPIATSTMSIVRDMGVQCWAASVPRTRILSYGPVYNGPGVAGSMEAVCKPKLFDGTISLV